MRSVKIEYIDTTKHRQASQTFVKLSKEKFPIIFMIGKRNCKKIAISSKRILDFKLINLDVRISSVVYRIQKNAVDEHTQTHSFNIIGSSGNLAAVSNPAVEGSSAGRILSRQPANDL
ncbi:MAG: hypothetical protein JSR51_05530 [Proteobacteria bacterium]|nr:hypothetical protein [Pseudomonadota bacterium]